MLGRLSLRVKLVAIIALVSTVTLTGSLALFVWWDLNGFRQQLIDEKQSQAEIVATNTGAPLLFSDDKAAFEILKSLKYYDEVESAQLYRTDGTLLSSYAKPGLQAPASIDPTTSGVSTERGERLFTRARVYHEREYVGDLLIVSSMRPWFQRRDAFVGFTLMLAAVSLVASMLFAINLQRIVSGPILKLSEAMREVSRTKNYGVRVQGDSGDEVGLLVTGFNTMLAEIKLRDEALTVAKDELEERVRLRTAELRQEVVERKAREADARSSQKQLADFFETAPIGIVRLDEQGRILVANQAELDIYGHDLHAFLGRNLDEFHVDTDDLRGLLAKLRNGETVQDYEGAIRTKNGETRIVQINATPYRQDGVFVYAGLFTRDVTVIRRAEEAERATERAERANQAKNEFLSRMSHELRTPLNSILGFSQLLEMEPLDERPRECVEQIMKGGKHLLNLINEVLNISRIESGSVSVSLEPIEVGVVVQEAIDLVNPMAVQHGVRIHNEVGHEPAVYVMADRQRLSQVLLNLLTNGVKYTGSEGEVWCRTRVLPSGRVEISVEDNGPGIPSDVRGRLFVPFDRLGAEQSEIEGTGLGLPLSKSLADAMQGHLYLDSQDDSRGSRFVIELAPADPQNCLVSDLEFEFDASPMLRATHHTVLLIEDNLANVKLIEQLLQSRPGVRLLVAMQGTLGLEFAKEHHPDVILLDNNLPDVLGLWVAEALANDPVLAEIPVVFMSADATLKVREDIRRRQNLYFLPKPLEIPRFMEVLDQLLRHEVRLSA